MSTLLAIIAVVIALGIVPAATIAGLIGWFVAGPVAALVLAVIGLFFDLG